MKNIFVLIFSVLVCQITKGQEFSFPMYFEDAIGNKDTLIFGYDINGTDTIDPIFEEVNIIDIPLNSVFDIRITNEWYNRFYQDIPGTFHTKKQIISGFCGGSSIITIDFKCENWPVTASWDNTVFEDTCRNGSVFTSINPGGWWDTGSPSDLLLYALVNTGQVTFTSNNSEYSDNWFEYINNQDDTIPVFWLAFGDSTLLVMDIDEMKQDDLVRIFPNPAKNTVIIQGLKSDYIIKSVMVYDLSVKKQDIIFIDDNISVGHLKKGVYLLKIEFTNGHILSRKIIIE